MTDRTRGKVIPFAQNAAFYLKRGEKNMKQNNLLGALHRYRLAYDAAPDQPETVLALSEILCCMQRYEESNRLLLILLSQNDDLPECHFGLACNYFGMREYDYAADSLERYLDLDPDGPYAIEAEDFLDMLDDDAAMLEIAGVCEDADYDANAACIYAKHLMDAGDCRGAVSLLKRERQHEPDSVPLLNELALAHLCCGERAKAAALTEELMQSGQANLATKCNHALILCAQNDRAGAKREVDEVLETGTDAPETLGSVSLLLMELEYWAEAEETLQKLATELPYDADVLHRLGFCRYRLRDYEGAQACYRKLLRIDPNDTVAAYYLKQSKKTDADARHIRSHWMIAYQVPLGETFRRISQLNKSLALPEKEQYALWNDDPHFAALLSWALTVGDERVKRSALLLIGLYADARAERMLRDFLLRTDQPDSLKRAVFGMLKELGAKEPYMAYLDGRWMQGRVSLLALTDGAPPRYREIMQYLIENMSGYRSEACLTASAELFSRYIAGMNGNYPRLSTMQEAALAAALEYLGCLSCSEEADEDELCERYRITQTRLHNALLRLAPYVANEEETT